MTEVAVLLHSESDNADDTETCIRHVPGFEKTESPQP
jgi:hypothetical protein